MIELPENDPFGFDEGWEILGRYKDNLGDEWEHVQIFIRKNYPWYFGHITMTEFCRLLDIKVSKLF